MREDIPIIIDDIKEYDGFRMSRCSYFSIECDDPTEGWTLGLENQNIPFIMLGLKGIVYSTLGDSGLFENASDIEAFFKLIEDNEKGLYIDINDIWVPNSVFEDKELFRIGSVYRMRFELFRLCYNFRNQRITKEQFIDYSNEFRFSLNFSPFETTSFEIWSKNQVEEAIENYNENSKMALEYIEESNEGGDLPNQEA